MSFSSHFNPHLLLQYSDFYSRRLLLHTSLYNPRTSGPPPSSSPTTINSHDASTESYSGDTSFDANVVMVLSVLLCALIFSLGLNSIVRCALRCLNLVGNSEDDHSNNRVNPSTAASARLATTGVKKKALKTFPIVHYLPELKLPGLDTDCIICLSEFNTGDRVRLLPKCNHGFHIKCIDKWLSTHSSCPKCRQCLIETCHKIIGGCGGGATTTMLGSSSEVPRPVVVQESVVSIGIGPLEPEDLVRSYR